MLSLRLQNGAHEMKSMLVRSVIAAYGTIARGGVAGTATACRE